MSVDGDNLAVYYCSHNYLLGSRRLQQSETEDTSPAIDSFSLWLFAVVRLNKWPTR